MDRIKKLNIHLARLEPCPLDRAAIVAGEPHASRLSLHERADGTGTGIWECTPGCFELNCERNQSLSVLSGDAVVEVAGELLELGPGDAAFFPKGTRARWTVRSTLRKLYTLYP